METKKYRLGNQNQEYELRTKYLGWLPSDGSSWKKVFPLLSLSSEIEGKELTLTNPEGNQSVTLIIDHEIIKGAFPLSFYGEERAKNWYNFCVVSTREMPLEKFIIPLH